VGVRLRGDGRLALAPTNAVTADMRGFVTKHADRIAAALIVEVAHAAAQRCEQIWPAEGGADLLDDPRLSMLSQRITEARARLDHEAVERGCGEFVAFVRAFAAQERNS
jgi:hypothetical protein